MEYSNLWNRVNYRSDIPYMINSYIREYDLSKANISSLYHFKVISDKEYHEFLSMPKRDREIKIGLMIKENSDIYEYIKEGILFAKKELVKTNKIYDSEIISIKNDAMFIHGRNLPITDFGGFKFVVKNTFKTYLNLGSIEVYYTDYDNNGSIESSITIKGISDTNLQLHSDGMLSIINQICFMIDRYTIADVLTYLMGVYVEFRNRRLPMNYYRTFDSNSKYIIQSQYMVYFIDYASNDIIGNVDLTVNDAIFRELISIVFDIYHSRYKK